jgi:hypothetical protein
MQMYVMPSSDSLKYPLEIDFPQLAQIIKTEDHPVRCRVLAPEVRTLKE